MKSDFMEWFVAQHNPRTDSGLPNHTDQQLRDMAHAGRVAERVMTTRQLWDDKRTSARYAWEAHRPHAGKDAEENAERGATTERPNVNEHKALTIKALGQILGDDLYRARNAFRNCTPKQMTEQYGESGKTRAEMLAGYEAHEAEVKAAIAWVQTL